MYLKMKFEIELSARQISCQDKLFKLGVQKFKYVSEGIQSKLVSILLLAKSAEGIGIGMAISKRVFQFVLENDSFPFVR